jgi:hypothetical protein
MDITLTTGRTFYQVDATLAAILIELGLAEKIAKPAPPSPHPPAGYTVGTVFRGERIRPCVVKHDGLGGTCYYRTPEGDVPKDVVAEWKKAVLLWDAQEEAKKRR